jgi:uridine kinase
MDETRTRAKVINRLVSAIATLECDHPLRVAIDGVDAAGKTRLADELVTPIEKLGHPVIRASIDGFHYPREHRYQRGHTSPLGYYLDSFNLAALRETLLLPLGPGGNCHYRRAVFDYRQDVVVDSTVEIASQRAILLFDGVFLLRPELVTDWDYSVFVAVDFDVSLSRALARDLPQDARPDEIQALRHLYQQRYMPGQRIYLQEARPWENANVVLDNNHWEFPRLEREG